MKKLISVLTLGAALGTMPILGSAVTLDTTSAALNDGILQNFTGIDWHSNGAGLVNGFDLTSANNAGDSDTFTFVYQAFAGTIQTTTPTPNLYVAPPGAATGGYELTTIFTLSETATCLNAGCSAINIATTGGNWNIWFDSSPDANQLAGTGFTDGTSILSGVWTGGGGIFSASGTVGPGSFGTGSATLVGTVTATNNAFVNPNLVGTDFQSSLQFPGQNPPSYTRPAAVNGVATGPDTADRFVLQTDGSQSFTAVPEPATLLMMGMGLVGFSLRRKKA